jgi:hypothetical protein
MCNRKSSVKTKNIIKTIVVLILLISSVNAQQIVFINPEKGKIIHVNEGEILSVRYRGYLGQTEYFKNTLTEIRDSSFILGFPLGNGSGLLGAKIDQQMQIKEVKYADIIAFRRISVGRNIIKSTLTTGVAIGSFLLLSKLYEGNKISNFGKIGISLGVGLSINMLINIALPDKPKHQIKDGWQIKNLKE